MAKKTETAKAVNARGEILSLASAIRGAKITDYLLHRRIVRLAAAIAPGIVRLTGRWVNRADCHD